MHVWPVLFIFFFCVLFFFHVFYTLINENKLPKKILIFFYWKLLELIFYEIIAFFYLDLK
jgi:hypothetical protein